jgi:NADPH-dependent curcumin reductase
MRALLDVARVPVCSLTAQYNAPGKGAGQLPTTMREILSKSLTLRGFINNECAAEHSPASLHEAGIGIDDGRLRYREEIVNCLEKAPKAFLGMLEERNFGTLIGRVDA